jgi:hypothetical protein
MMLSVREAWRRLRSPNLQEVQPDWSHEVLKSLRGMHQEHVKDLCQLGYSPKEAFWLDFACVPFLPWSRSAPGRMELHTVLDLYTDLYCLTVGSLEPADPAKFTALLQERYHRIRKMVATSGGLHQDGARVETGVWADPGQQKWAQAGLLVLWTARAWQRHPSAFPCRLVED